MLDFDSNALYEALKDVCDLTNTTITLYDDNKNSLFSYEPYPCTLCQKIHIIKVISDKCKRCDKEAIDKASKSPYIYKCHMGMTEVMLPVIKNDKIIAYLSLGKIIKSEDIPFLKKRIQLYCQKYELPETELLNAADKIPVVTVKTLSACTNILTMLSSHLLMNNIITPNMPPLSIQIDSYIATHLNADLSVSALCSHFKISKSQLYKISVENYSCGISEHVKKLRIKEAKRLLFCSLSITQVAEAVGMSDSNYFIKIFKKETGYTPLKYKKTLKDCT